MRAKANLTLASRGTRGGKRAYVEPGRGRQQGAVMASRSEKEGGLVVSGGVTRKSVRVRLRSSAALAEDLSHLGPEPLDPAFDDAALAHAASG